MHAPYVCGFAWGDVEHGGMAYTELALRQQQFHVAPAMPALKHTASVDIQKHAIKSWSLMQNRMQAQWVCSREQRMALYKRSSINQSPWKHKDKLAYLCSVQVNRGLTHSIKRGSFFSHGWKAELQAPKFIGTSKLECTQHATGLVQHSFDAPVKNRKAPTEVNKIRRHHLEKTKWISPVTDLLQALWSS